MKAYPKSRASISHQWISWGIRKPNWGRISLKWKWKEMKRKDLIVRKSWKKSLKDFKKHKELAFYVHLKNSGKKATRLWISFTQALTNRKIPSNLLCSFAIFCIVLCLWYRVPTCDMYLRFISTSIPSHLTRIMSFTCAIHTAIWSTLSGLWKTHSLYLHRICCTLQIPKIPRKKYSLQNLSTIQ